MITNVVDVPWTVNPAVRAGPLPALTPHICAAEMLVWVPNASVAMGELPEQDPVPVVRLRVIH